MNNLKTGKQNKTMRVGVVATLIALLTLCCLAFTMAKYVSLGTAQDDARVAKGGIGIDVKENLNNLFSTAYDLNGDPVGDASATYGVKSSNTDNVIAPGTHNTQTVAVVNISGGAPEVMYDFDVDLSIRDKGDSSSATKSTVALLDANPAGTGTVTTPKESKEFQTHAELETYIKNNLSQKSIAPNTLPDWLTPEDNNLVIGWNGVYHIDASIDELDTEIGMLSAQGLLDKMQVTLNMSATQVQQENMRDITVAFDTLGGSMNPVSQIHKAGDKVNKPNPDPTKEGYEFLGGYKEPECTNEGNFDTDTVPDTLSDHVMILYAGGESTGPTYTMTFNATGCAEDPATITNIPENSTYTTEGNTLTVTKPDGTTVFATREVSPDDTHIGTATGNPISGTITGDTEVSVSFADAVSVSPEVIDNTGGKGIKNSTEDGTEPIKIEKGTSATGSTTTDTATLTIGSDTYSTSAQTGYALSESTINPELIDGKIENNTTVSATFKKLVTITFDGNSAEGGTVPDPQTKMEGSTINLPDNTGSLIKSGYTFAGGNTNAEGSGTHYDVDDTYTIPSDDTTLYVQGNVIVTLNINSTSMGGLYLEGSDDPLTTYTIPGGVPTGTTVESSGPTNYTEENPILRTINNITSTPNEINEDAYIQFNKPNGEKIVKIIAKPTDGNTFKEGTGITSPITGPLTNPITATFEALGHPVEYAVCIWQIDGNDGAGPQTITGGPATGADYDTAITNATEIEDDGATIKANANAGRAHEKYDTALSEGHIKKITINLNDTLYSGTEPTKTSSALYSTINSNYRNGNYSYTGYSADDPASQYNTSRIRATLNGYDNEGGGSFTPHPTYAYPTTGNDCLTKDNCLLSCFPTDLQNVIKTRTYNVPTRWTKSRKYPITSGETVTDKLGLPNATEVGGYASTSDYGEEGFSQFKKKVDEGTTASSYSKNKVYNESGSANIWWLRSPNRYDYSGAARGNTNGYCNGNYVGSANCSLAPCFCL